MIWDKFRRSRGDETRRPTADTETSMTTTNE